MKQNQTKHRTNRKTQNPTQNQTTRTMKLRNKLDAMDFFQTLHNWLSGLLRPEKETTQPQLQIQNPMEQHQTKHRTNRKPQNPKPCIRLFSPLTNAITAFIMSAVLICIPNSPMLSLVRGDENHFCYDTLVIQGISQPSCDCRFGGIIRVPGLPAPFPYPKCARSGLFFATHDRCVGVYSHHDGDKYNTWCNNSKKIPVKYSRCRLKLDWYSLLSCALLSVGCIAACASSPSGWGLVGCIACLAGEGLLCARPCSLFYCEARVEPRTHLNAKKKSGGTCPDDHTTNPSG